MSDLVIARRRRGRAYSRRMLKPVQRRLARQRFAAIAIPFALLARQIALARKQRQQRIVPQLVVIVEVLVAQRQPVDALAHQLAHAVLAALGVAMIAEARRQPLQQLQPPVDLAQQDRSPVGADRAAVKPRRHSPPEMLAELELNGRTRLLVLNKADKIAPETATILGRRFDGILTCALDNDSLLPLIGKMDAMLWPD